MKFLLDNLRRFKLITFDSTGTLLYFKNPPHQQYLKTSAFFGLKTDLFDESKMKANFRSEFKQLNMKYPLFGRDTISYPIWWEQLVTNVLVKSSRQSLDAEKLSLIAKKLILQYQTDECWGKFDKSNELITAFKDAGKIVGVVSNFDPRLTQLLKNMKLPDFDFVLTSYEAAVEKPNPEMFKEAIKMSGQHIDPSEALHVGNEIDRDYKGAKAASWSAVLVNSDQTEVQPSYRDMEHFWNVITTEKVEF